MVIMTFMREREKAGRAAPDRRNGRTKPPRRRDRRRSFLVSATFLAHSPLSRTIFAGGHSACAEPSPHLFSSPLVIARFLFAPLAVSDSISCRVSPRLSSHHASPRHCLAPCRPSSLHRYAISLVQLHTHKQETFMNNLATLDVVFAKSCLKSRLPKLLSIATMCPHTHCIPPASWVPVCTRNHTRARR